MKGDRKMIKKKKFLSRKDRGLSKYDAPLHIQYKRGFNAFFKNEKTSYGINTMQYREWLRGWHDAFVKQLEKVKNAEARRRSEKIYA